MNLKTKSTNKKEKKMTDEERNQKFDDKKRRVAIELLGIDPLSKDVLEASNKIVEPEVRVVDPLWGKANAKSWMERKRITHPMNNDIEGLNRYDPNASDTRTQIGPDFYAGWKLAKHDD